MKKESEELTGGDILWTAYWRVSGRQRLGRTSKTRSDVEDSTNVEDDGSRLDDPSNGTRRLGKFGEALEDFEKLGMRFRN